MKPHQKFTKEYLSFHVPKEDLFWTTYMGIEPNTKALQNAEQGFNAYISDPTRLAEVEAALSKIEEEDKEARSVLQGWKQFFASNSLTNPAAIALQTEVSSLEGKLFEKRNELKMYVKDVDGKQVEASRNVVAMNLTTSDDEGVRKSSHDALMELEKWVLEEGFLEIVKKRNEFARAAGASNFFEFKLKRTEGMSVKRLFEVLDEFEALTRETCFRQNNRVKEKHGPQAVLPHNFKYFTAGDSEKELDPYFQFGRSLEVWSRSFGALGIEYRGAELNLDLFDRTGKYDNGFMHGPQPSYLEDGKWHPARINFTSNANPTQVGSGRHGLMVLFHEGGHAAHFSNIVQGAPCFSQEFPPTSMAYAETQSMFCDSLVGDGDWMKCYGKNNQGEVVPDELIRHMQHLTHPLEAMSSRSIMVVSYFEKRLYEMNESELTPRNVLALARECEKKILGLDCSPRPILTIPHILSWDSACSYHGYLLAQMAVYQTRNQLLKKYGKLSNNPKVGEELAEHYWACGNSVPFEQTLRAMTGEPLSGKYLADHCNLSESDLWARTVSQIKGVKPFDPAISVDLNAHIKIVHGKETIASNDKGMEGLWKDFERWVSQSYGRNPE